MPNEPRLLMPPPHADNPYKRVAAMLRGLAASAKAHGLTIALNIPTTPPVDFPPLNIGGGKAFTSPMMVVLKNRRDPLARLGGLIEHPITYSFQITKASKLKP